MVDYFPVPSSNSKQPAPAAGGGQDLPEPMVEVVYTVSEEHNNAQTIAVKISIRLPLTS